MQKKFFQNYAKLHKYAKQHNSKGFDNPFFV